MNALAQTISHTIPAGFGNRVNLFRQVADVAQRTGQMLTQRVYSPIRIREYGNIQELDRVRLLADVMTSNGLLTSGAEGTAVYRYRDGVAFEVEFFEPVEALLTLRVDEIARLYA